MNALPFSLPFQLVESDNYSGGTESKNTVSSKGNMELYETQTNGTKPSTVSLNHMGLSGKGGITETSISGGEDELISNKSDDRFSGQTDYEMVSTFWSKEP